MSHAIRSICALSAAALASSCAPQARPEGASRASATVATAQMLGPRQLAGAAQLPDGRVFVSGGIDGYGNVLDFAEKFETTPAPGKWSYAWPVGQRYQHTATTLPGGTILLAGGVSATSVVPKALVCTPISGCNGAGDMLAPRVGHTATLLGDGRVLVVGGQGGAGQTLDSVEIWDPALNAWKAGPPLPLPRMGHAAVLLADGRVLVASGTRADSLLFDPSVGTWTPAGVVPAATSAGAAVLTDGRVLVAGGKPYGSAGSGAEALVYDPAAASWTPTGSLIAARAEHALLALPDGGAIAFGGNLAGTGLDSVERWDPASGSWTPLAPLSVPRDRPSAFPIGNGAVLVVGGVDPAGSEIYQLADGCIPTTCAAQGLSCGTAPDGCGGTLDCGTCPGGEVCSAGVCAPPCVPTTCAALGASCGTVPDGCGGTLSCGTCPAGQTCAASNACETAPACAHSECVTGTKLVSTCSSCAATVCGYDSFCCASSWDGQCVSEAKNWCGGLCGPTCTPTTCAAQGKTCGNIGDGCGGTLDCGTCPAGEVCSAGVCASPCVPATCAALGASCGTVPDGCGGTLSCGTCPAGQTCSASNACETAPACAHPECVTGTKLVSTCSSCAATVCASDSYCCNASWDGQCVSEAKGWCGGLCGATCTPTTCAAQGKTCGTIGDGCGGTLHCGTCPAGQTCSGSNACVAGSGCTHSECTTGVPLASTCSACAATVCAKDSYCCTTSWDSLCVSEAKSWCGGVCGAAAACTHSECVTGTKLVSGCSSCATTVCASDAYCCSTSWDGYCVNEAKSWCGPACP